MVSWTTLEKFFIDSDDFVWRLIIIRWLRGYKFGRYNKLKKIVKESLQSIFFINYLQGAPHFFMKVMLIFYK